MLFTLTALACSGPPDPPAPPATIEAPADARPDIVLVLLDTTRSDHLGPYGYEGAATPWLDGLASRGVVFDRAWSTSSWTAPSTASLFTGLYPTQHGIVQGLKASRGAVSEQGREGYEINFLHDELTLLPEVMRAAGYRTLGVANNPNISDEIGFNRGFDQFLYEKGASVEVLGEQLTDWWGAGGGPTFAYMHLNDAHYPYEPRAPWYEPADGEAVDLQRAYDSEIAWLDHHLGRLDAALGWEDAWVFVVSDHGEAFGEHGFNNHPKGLFRELTQIVWIAAGPGIATGRSAATASLVDVPVTLAELAEAAFPPGEGRSMVAELRAPGTAEDRVVFSHRRGGNRNVWSAQRGDLHLIRAGDQDSLFDIAADPLEASPRPAAESAALSQELDAFMDRAGEARSKIHSVNLSAGAMEQLRALGYVE